MLWPVSRGKAKGNYRLVQCSFHGSPFFTPLLLYKVANKVADVISAALRPDFFRVPPYRVCRHCHCACGVLLVVMLFVQFRVMAFPLALSTSSRKPCRMKLINSLRNCFSDRESPPPSSFLAFACASSSSFFVNTVLPGLDSCALSIIALHMSPSATLGGS